MLRLTAWPLLAWQAHLLLWALSSPLHGSPPCPAACNCTLGANAQRTVSCSRAGLSHVPHELPADTAVLLLDGNRIGALPAGLFQGLLQLREMNLSGNVIQSVSAAAFPEGITFLDLSANRLLGLPRELKQLKARVRLDGNPLHCGCQLQELFAVLDVDARTANGVLCATAVVESARGRPFFEVMEKMNFCNMPRKTTDVAMLVTMFGWFAMVVAYIAYYVRTNQEDARRHIEYLKSLPSAQFRAASEGDTHSTML
ncbi:leucine-rich repeat-containing protein 3-like [Lethenteron reissneri]|uniref:leucine-rich repeat-containing protein 3-like n=1 Tax=Lethenteron reissneri TaxID=7753 RepID=UPI002AB7032D|nr:leucine-rich repeat-containing protein 3-like [Lethenteron reissneri]